MPSDFVDLVRNIMNESNMTSTQLSEITGINKGNISFALNNNKVPFKMFFKIARALNLPLEQHLMTYLMTRINEKRTAWRFVKAAFDDCMSMNEPEIAISIICLYLETEESTQHTLDIFTIINNFHIKFSEHQKNLLPIYTKLSSLQTKIKNENDTILAIIQYRIVSIRMNNGETLKGEINHLLNYGLESLPLQMRLNALYQFCLLLLMHHKDWQVLEDATKQMIGLVKHIISSEKKVYVTDEIDEPLLHPLVRYYGQGFLMQSSSFRYRENFDKAVELINEYRDLSWFPDLDEEGWKHVDRFKVFAIANTFYYELLRKNITVIEPYINYLKCHQEEMLPGVAMIFEALNATNSQTTQDVIDIAYELIILRGDLMNHHSYYIQEKRQREYLRLIYQFTKYLIRTKSFINAIEIALILLESSLSLKESDMIVKAIALIESCKKKAQPHHMLNYEKVRERIVDYEKVI